MYQIHGNLPHNWQDTNANLALDEKSKDRQTIKIQSLLTITV